MYESPLEIIYKDVQHILEEEIFYAIQKVDIKVNKEELIKALEYDRKQYEKGFEDGMKMAGERKKGKWIEPIRCEQCKHSRKCITGGYRCSLWMITRMADDFCSEADRRMEKTDDKEGGN